MTQNSNIGLELKLARIIAKLSQKEVTAAVGITVPYLSMIENDAVTPSARLLRDLREAVRWTPQVAALVKAQEKHEQPMQEISGPGLPPLRPSLR